jgi:glucose/arabinose dehydrogenase
MPRAQATAVALLAGLLLGGCGSSHPAGSTAARAGTSASSATGTALVAIGAGLEGPAGLKASVYARGLPTVAAVAYDPHGRLWAAAAGLSTHGRDGVYLIAHPGAHPQRVISGLDDPLGLVWYGGRLYVSSVGRVSVYSDFTGSRFRHQVALIHGPVRMGENNDLVLSPSGRFVMGITVTCDHCRPRSRYSGSIVSFRPNGSDLQLYAARIRAPVGLAFYPGTSELLATINQRDDLGARTPGDWLAVIPPGSDWRFPGCYGQGGAACAGVPAPLASLDQHAAVGSVVVVTGQLGPAVGTAALVAEWQTSKVARVALRGHGSGLRGTPSVMLRGMRDPLALALAPDGSLIAGDWGTGVIYRITRA